MVVRVKNLGGGGGGERKNPSKGLAFLRFKGTYVHSISQFVNVLSYTLFVFPNLYK